MKKLKLKEKMLKRKEKREKPSFSYWPILAELPELKWSVVY